jgi:hypothetical protein
MRARVMGSMIDDNDGDDDDDDDDDEDLSFHVGRTLYDWSLAPQSLCTAQSSLFLSRAAKRFPETKQTIPRQREIKSTRGNLVSYLFFVSFHEG